MAHVRPAAAQKYLNRNNDSIWIGGGGKKLSVLLKCNSQSNNLQLILAASSLFFCDFLPFTATCKCGVIPLLYKPHSAFEMSLQMPVGL